MSSEVHEDRWSSRVVHVEALSPTVRRLVLEAAAPLNWRGGQHVALRRRAEQGPDSYYSFAAAADEPGQLRFELAVGRGPATIGELRLGDEVYASAPRGPAMLDQLPKEGPLLLVAMGTGVAPLRAVLQEHERGLRAGVNAPRPVTLVHGARQLEESLFAANFREVSREPWFEYVPVLSRPSADWQGKTGWVQDSVQGLVSPGTSCLVCGSLPMVEATRERLLAAGVEAGAILAEGY